MSSRAAFSNEERCRLSRAAAGRRSRLRCEAAGIFRTGARGILRIRDTLHLEDLYVSPAVVKEVSDDPRVEIIGNASDLFDEHGELTPF